MLFFAGVLCFAGVIMLSFAGVIMHSFAGVILFAGVIFFVV